MERNLTGNRLYDPSLDQQSIELSVRPRLPQKPPRVKRRFEDATDRYHARKAYKEREADRATGRRHALRKNAKDASRPYTHVSRIGLPFAKQSNSQPLDIEGRDSIATATLSANVRLDATADQWERSVCNIPTPSEMSAEDETSDALFPISLQEPHERNHRRDRPATYGRSPGLLAPPDEYTSLLARPLWKPPQPPLWRRFLRTCWIVLSSNYSHILLLLIPVAHVAQYLDWPSEAVLVLNGLPMLPLTQLVAMSVEELGAVFGDAVAGVLGYSFGNAGTIIISCILLQRDEILVVQTSLLGAIIFNLLAIIGCQFFVGGIRSYQATFNQTLAQVNGSVLLLSVANISLPAIVRHIQGQRSAVIVSRMQAISSVIVYLLLLLFQFKSHVELQKAPPLYDVDAALFGERDEHDSLFGVVNEEDFEPTGARLAPVASIPLLVVTTAALVVTVEFFVNTLDEVTQHHDISRTFIGFIILPVVSNSLSHLSEIGDALNNKMHKATNVAIGCSVQLALFETCGPSWRALPDHLSKIQYQNPDNPVDSAFQLGHGTQEHFFEWISKRPERLSQFQNHMAGKRVGRSSWMDLNFYPVESNLIDGARTDQDAVFLVDVGGGKGHDLEKLHKKHQDLPGKLILQDVKDVIKEARTAGLNDRFEKMEHDFFTKQLVLGARAYYMHTCLHDWPDREAHEIFENLKPAMAKGYSKLLINEHVISDQGAHWQSTSMDMIMLANFSASERTEQSWRSLLETAGFRVIKFLTFEPGTESLSEAELA